MEIKTLENILNKKNIPTTAMRLLVLDEFRKTSNAISLSELEEKLHPADRSTIYRTLKTFEKKGLIHGVQENNSTQYLLCQDNCGEEHHHDFHLHFYCSECKKTTCLEKVNFETIVFPDDYQINELKFVANGICPNCQSKH